MKHINKIVAFFLIVSFFGAMVALTQPALNGAIESGGGSSNEIDIKVKSSDFWTLPSIYILDNP